MIHSDYVPVVFLSLPFQKIFQIPQYNSTIISLQNQLSTPIKKLVNIFIISACKIAEYKTFGGAEQVSVSGSEDCCSVFPASPLRAEFFDFNISGRLLLILVCEPNFQYFCFFSDIKFYITPLLLSQLWKKLYVIFTFYTSL